MSKRTGGRRPPSVPQVRLTPSPNEIMTCAPLRQSSLQMEAGWEGPRGPKTPRWWWDGCPNLRAVPSCVPDLTGIAWGRIVVVGLAPSKPGNGPAAWVVRCSCGSYETRIARAIGKKSNPDECCHKCGYNEHLKRLDFYNRHGRWPDGPHGSAGAQEPGVRLVA